MLASLRQEQIEQSQPPVEALVCIVNQALPTLPADVHLEPGRITVEFDHPQEALEKLLA